jgi:hypothetical protein
VAVVRAYAFQNQDGDFISPYAEGDRLQLSYVGVIDGAPDESACESIFERLNRDDRENRYVAPSLSVGDVITLIDGEEVYSWAVERNGFRRVAEALPSLEQADAYHSALAESLPPADPTAAAPPEGAPPLRDTLAVRGWLASARERLVDDSDAIADVDIIYGLYTSLTGEEIPHPYEEADDAPAELARTYGVPVRDPYVGEGADGARRSARIDREEAETLPKTDARRTVLELSARRWDDQAAFLEAEGDV